MIFRVSLLLILSNFSYAQNQCLNIYAKTYALMLTEKHHQISEDSDLDINARENFEKETQDFILKEASAKNLQYKLSGFEKLKVYQQATKLSRSEGLNCCYYDGASNFGENKECEIKVCPIDSRKRYLEREYTDFQIINDARIYRSVNRKFSLSRIKDSSSCQQDILDFKHGFDLIFSLGRHSFELRDIIDEHFGGYKKAPKPSKESRELISNLLDLDGDYSSYVNNFIKIEQERIDQLPPEPVEEKVDERNGFEKFLDGLSKTAEFASQAKKYIASPPKK